MTSSSIMIMVMHVRNLSIPAYNVEDDYSFSGFIYIYIHLYTWYIYHLDFVLLFFFFD